VKRGEAMQTFYTGLEQPPTGLEQPTGLPWQMVNEVIVKDCYGVVERFRPGARVIDVGANVGIFTMWAAAHRCDVLAVEADPDLYVALRENIIVWGYRTITPVHAAVGHGSASMDDSNCPRTIEGGDVPGVMLDELISWTSLDGDERVDILKIDCEGCEEAALLGASHELLARVDYITAELHGPPAWNPGVDVEKIVAHVAVTHDVEYRLDGDWYMQAVARR
jgi:FkbM family methyltransferase